MKFAGREMTTDEAILTSEGTLMCLSAASLFAKPAWTQEKITKGGLGGAGSASDPMARLAGVALGAAGAHVILSGNADRVSQRRSAKITAASSAVVSGLALTQIGAGNPDSSSKNKLVGVAVLGALNAVLMGRMAYREDKLL